MKDSLRIVAAVSVLLLMMAASAQAVKVDNSSGNESGISIPTLTPVVSVDNTSLKVNESGTVDVDLELLPVDGFAYANVSVNISDPSVTELTGVSFPDWAVLNQSSTLPSTMWFKVGDLHNSIKIEDEEINFGTLLANATLATLRVKGLEEGTSDINIVLNSFQCDSDYQEIKHQVYTIPGTVTVKEGPPWANDLDGDGLYEDVNGDGNLNFGDVVELFKNFESSKYKGYKKYFEFREDGSLNSGDFIALFEML